MSDQKMSAASFHALYERMRGRSAWGAADRRGALNHITPARLAAAAGEVRAGRTVTMASPLASSAPDNPEPGTRHMKRLPAEPSDVPGPFGNYLLATTHTMQRSTSTMGSGPAIDSQDWVFQAPTGEHLELHIKYERGVANKGNPADVKFYSAKNPSFFQISRQEQVLDILRNATTDPPDRVKEFSFKAGGGSYAKLFDGTEKLLSWDNIVWINRSVLLP